MTSHIPTVLVFLNLPGGFDTAHQMRFAPLVAIAISAQESDQDLREPLREPNETGNSSPEINKTKPGAEEFDALLWNLGHGSLADRNAAEQELVRVGTQFLNWFDSTVGDVTIHAETRFRIQRIRSSVFESLIRQTRMASSLTLPDLSDSERLEAEFVSQTQNQVKLPDGCVSLSQTGTFWEVFSNVCQQNRLSIVPEKSNDHRLFLTRQSADRSRWQPTGSAGVMRVDLVESDGANSGQSATDRTAQIRLRIFWEPRLRLVALQIPMDRLQLLDAGGNAWASFNQQAVYNIPPPATRNFTLVRLPVKANSNEPSPSEIELGCKMFFLAPATNCQFDLSRIDLLRNTNTSKIPTEQIGMATINVESILNTDDGLVVRLRTEYDAEKMALPLRSHVDWSRYCSASIQGPQESAFLPLAQKQIQQSSYEYVIDYTFPTEAGKTARKLTFQIPAGITLADETLKFKLGAKN